MRTRLQVFMELEVSIDHPDASDTFIDTIHRIGIDEVRDLKIDVDMSPYRQRTLPLIVTEDEWNAMEFDDRKEYTEHNYGKRKYWIHTTNSTQKKRELLEEIAEQLGYIDMNVEVVPK